MSRGKAVIVAMWRLFRAYFFYPIMIGLFLWLFLTGAHWVFGLLVILAILVLDQTWFIIARNMVQMVKRKSD